MTTDPASRIIALATKGAETDIVLSRRLSVERHRAFDACLDAETIGAWWGPDGFTTLTHHMDPREGGTWHHTMVGPDGQEYENFVTYRTLERPNRIEYDIRPSLDAPVHFRAVLVFEPEGDGTQITFTCRFPTREARDQAAQFGAAVGLQQHLDRYQDYLQGNPSD